MDVVRGLITQDERVLLESMRHEHKKVNLLLQAIGMTRLRSELIQNEEREFGDRRLTFRRFHEIIDNFPIHLKFQLLFKLESELNCSLSSLMKRPQDSHIFRYWDGFRQELSAIDVLDTRPVGLVFPFSKITGGLVVHNSRFRVKTTTVQRRCLIFDFKDFTLRVERFRDLLAAIRDSGWSPGPKAPRRPQRLRAAPILRRVKGAPQKLVAQFFINILNGHVERRPDWAGSQRLVRRIAGERWISLTQGEIGDALGLSADQVRRALRNLRSVGIVQAESSGSENIYRITVTGDAGDP